MNRNIAGALALAGADLKITDKNGVTAASQAEEYANRQALAVLQRGSQP